MGGGAHPALAQCVTSTPVWLQNVLITHPPPPPDMETPRPQQPSPHPPHPPPRPGLPVPGVACSGRVLSVQSRALRPCASGVRVSAAWWSRLRVPHLVSGQSDGSLCGCTAASGPSGRAGWGGGLRCSCVRGPHPRWGRARRWSALVSGSWLGRAVLTGAPAAGARPRPDAGAAQFLPPVVSFCWLSSPLFTVKLGKTRHGRRSILGGVFPPFS